MSHAHVVRVECAKVAQRTTIPGSTCRAPIDAEGRRALKSPTPAPRTVFASREPRLRDAFFVMKEQANGHLSSS